MSKPFPRRQPRGSRAHAVTDAASTIAPRTGVKVSRVEVLMMNKSRPSEDRIRWQRQIPRLFVVIALATVGYGTSAALAPPVEAACAAPRITVEPDRGAPGSSVLVEGRNFAAECRDTVTCEVGEPCEEPEPSPPVENVTVLFTQGGETSEVGTAPPRDDYGFELEVEVPSDADGGAASFSARGSNGFETQPVDFTVEPADSQEVEEDSASTDGGTGDTPQALPATGHRSAGLSSALAVLGAAVFLRARHRHGASEQ